MPIYTYRCVRATCGHVQDELMRAPDRFVITVYCTECGDICRRQMAAPALFVGAKDWREPTTESLERKHKKTVRAIRGGRP